ncbi:unnamed protein product [Amoebophrya sp. A25]|nr:unnamed protein product [Amoebophrya sp. A25]|eukprot:GSA25T00003172001.1
MRSTFSSPTNPSKYTSPRITFNDIPFVDESKKKLILSVVSPHSDRAEVVRHICSVMFALPQGRQDANPYYVPSEYRQTEKNGKYQAKGGVDDQQVRRSLEDDAKEGSSDAVKTVVEKQEKDTTGRSRELATTPSKGRGTSDENNVDSSAMRSSEDDEKLFQERDETALYEYANLRTLDGRGEKGRNKDHALSSVDADDYVEGPGEGDEDVADIKADKGKRKITRSALISSDTNAWKKGDVLEGYSSQEEDFFTVGRAVGGYLLAGARSSGASSQFLPFGLGNLFAAVGDKLASAVHSISARLLMSRTGNDEVQEEEKDLNVDQDEGEDENRRLSSSKGAQHLGQRTLENTRGQDIADAVEWASTDHSTDHNTLLQQPGSSTSSSSQSGNLVPSPTSSFWQQSSHSSTADQQNQVEIPSSGTDFTDLERGKLIKHLSDGADDWTDPNGSVQYIVYLIPPHDEDAIDSPTTTGRGKRDETSDHAKEGTKASSTASDAGHKDTSKKKAKAGHVRTRHAEFVRLFEEMRQISNLILFDLCAPPVFSGSRKLSDITFVYDSDVVLSGLIETRLPNLDHIVLLSEKMFVQTQELWSDLHAMKQYHGKNSVHQVPEIVNVNEEVSYQLQRRTQATPSDLGDLVKSLKLDTLLTNQMLWMSDLDNTSLERETGASGPSLVSLGSGGVRQSALDVPASGNSGGGKASPPAPARMENNDYGVDPAFSYYHSDHYSYSGYEDNIFVWSPPEAGRLNTEQYLGEEYTWAQCILNADRRSLSTSSSSASGGKRQLAEANPPQEGTENAQASPQQNQVSVHANHGLAFVYGRAPEMLRYLHGLDFLLEKCGHHIFADALDLAKHTRGGPKKESDSTLDSTAVHGGTVLNAIATRLLQYFSYHPVPGAELIWHQGVGHKLGFGWNAKQVRTMDTAPLYLQFPFLYKGVRHFPQYLKPNWQVGPCTEWVETKGKDVAGHDVPNGAFSKPDLAHCKDACNTEHTCDTVAYLAASRMCYLKSEARQAPTVEKSGIFLAQCKHERY